MGELLNRNGRVRPHWKEERPAEAHLGCAGRQMPARGSIQFHQVRQGCFPAYDIEQLRQLIRTRVLQHLANSCGSASYPIEMAILRDVHGPKFKQENESAVFAAPPLALYYGALAL